MRRLMLLGLLLENLPRIQILVEHCEYLSALRIYDNIDEGKRFGCRYIARVQSRVRLRARLRGS